MIDKFDAVYSDINSVADENVEISYSEVEYIVFQSIVASLIENADKKLRDYEDEFTDNVYAEADKIQTKLMKQFEKEIEKSLKDIETRLES